MRMPCTAASSCVAFSFPEVFCEISQQGATVNRHITKNSCRGQAPCPALSRFKVRMCPVFRQISGTFRRHFPLGISPRVQPSSVSSVNPAGRSASRYSSTPRLTSSISPARRICTASGCRAARPVSHRINAWATAAGATVTSPSAPAHTAAAGCIAPSTRSSVRSPDGTSYPIASSSFPTVSAIQKQGTARRQ